jgi:hypothetical protein
MDRRHERRRSRQWRSHLESIFITWANLAKAKVVSRSKQVNWWSNLCGSFEEWVFHVQQESSTTAERCSLEPRRKPAQAMSKIAKIAITVVLYLIFKACTVYVWPA